VFAVEEYLAREDAAAFLGISTRTLDRYIQRKILKPHRKGKRMMFLRSDLETLGLAPDPKSQIVAEAEMPTLPAQPSAEMSALISLAQEMHRELKSKDHEIAELNFELGKYQEIAKNSVPLLEAAKRDRVSKDRLEYLQSELYKARFGKYIFLALFGFTLGALGILLNFLFIR
jgi:DNA-binding transcriptional MerR regulator